VSNKWNWDVIAGVKPQDLKGELQRISDDGESVERLDLAPDGTYTIIIHDSFGYHDEERPIKKSLESLPGPKKWLPKYFSYSEDVYGPVNIYAYFLGVAASGFLSQGKPGIDFESLAYDAREIASRLLDSYFETPQKKESVLNPEWLKWEKFHEKKSGEVDLKPVAE